MMRASKRTAITWWVCGLIAFAITLGFHVPLITESVPGGISEHQSAPDAATVNAIQASWGRDGLMNSAAIAMVTDLIFIGIYGAGCVLVGLHYRLRSSLALRLLGWGALVSGAVFLVTDYGETIAQFTQLLQGSGDDGLAAFASTLRPVKMVSWTTGFFTVLIAIIVDRFSTKAA